MKVETIGKSDEDRELVVVWVSSDENMQNLQVNRDNLAKIADPRGLPPERIRQLIATSRPHYHLMGGLHSGETGPSEMLMELVYRLATETSIGNKGSNVSSPVALDGHLYWMNDNIGVAYCAEIKTGKIVYEERVPGAGQVYSAAVLGDGKIYYLGRDGKCFVVAAKPKFELLAHNVFEDDDSRTNASPAVHNGQLLLRSDRYLYCIGKDRQ